MFFHVKNLTEFLSDGSQPGPRLFSEIVQEPVDGVQHMGSDFDVRNLTEKDAYVLPPKYLGGTGGVSLDLDYGDSFDYRTLFRLGNSIFYTEGSLYSPDRRIVFRSKWEFVNPGYWTIRARVGDWEDSNYTYDNYSTFKTEVCTQIKIWLDAYTPLGGQNPDDWNVVIIRGIKADYYARSGDYDDSVTFVMFYIGNDPNADEIIEI